jgi:hypothetical protein
MSHIAVLNTRIYGRNTVKLVPEHIDRVSLKMAQRLIEKGHKHSIVL